MTRENINYLKFTENLYKGLYRNDINHLKCAIEDVFNAFPLVQSFSPYYNDKRSMTKLLLMCTNQVVISSVNYLTKNNTVSIWNQSKELMTEKLNECIALKEHVFYCYNKTLNKIIAEERQEFKISLNTSLGNMIYFVERLDKVIENLKHKFYVNTCYLCSMKNELDNFFYIKQNNILEYLSKIIYVRVPKNVQYSIVYSY